VVKSEQETEDSKEQIQPVKVQPVYNQKAKTKWTERKQKVEHDKEKRQKKRQENLEKRSKDKKNRKLKTASKRGRIIPGY